MKLLNILKEIKINNPTDVIIVTDEGRKAAKKCSDMITSFTYFGLYDPSEYETELNLPHKYFGAQQLMMYSYEYGENIIHLDKPTPLEEYKLKLKSVFGVEEEEINYTLKNFIKYGFIQNNIRI